MVIHDPEDEYTVISSEGIGKGILRGNTIIVTEPMKVEIPNCPNCGNSTVRETPGAYVVRCSKCGHNWNPER